MEEHKVEITIHFQLEPPYTQIIDIETTLDNIESLIDLLIHIGTAQFEEDQTDNAFFPCGQYEITIILQDNTLFFDSPFKSRKKIQTICIAAASYLFSQIRPNIPPS